MSTTATAAKREQITSLSLVSKLLPLWIILAMAAGLLLGRFLPVGVGKVLEAGIPLGLFLMIYPAMTKLELGEIRNAAPAPSCRQSPRITTGRTIR
jgi:ACR3 family arsenite transporter